MCEPIRIPDIEKYIQEVVNGALILTPKKTYTTTDEFNKIILISSNILNCIIKKGDEIISNKLKYMSILCDVWGSIPIQKIKQTTTFNIKFTNENGYHGYKWCPKLKFSIQYKDATHTMREILHMVKENNLSINISIRLTTQNIINFKFNC